MNRYLLASAVLVCALLFPACAEMSAEDGALATTCGPTDGCMNIEVPDLVPVTVSLRIVPSDDLGLEEGYINNIELGDDSAAVVLVLDRLVSVSGAVTTSAGPISGATLTFRRSEGIEGVPYVRTATTELAGTYYVALPPGTYSATVRTEDASLPPIVRDLEVTTDTSFSPNFPDPAAYYVVTGQLVRTHETVAETDGEETLIEEVPIQRARVFLTSPTTGRVLSTEGETAEGAFSVRVHPTEADYAIRLLPGSGSEPLPDLTLETVHIADSTDLGTLVAGDWEDSVEVQGTVAGVNGSQQAIDGAAVFFVMELEHGDFTEVTYADADGRFSSSVIPGAYDVTLIPPANVEFAAQTFSGRVINPAGEQVEDSTFPLVHKPSLLGMVRDPYGAPLAGVTITAEPIDFEISALSLGPVSTVTDSSGNYLMQVHPGNQLLTLLPPSDSGLSPMLLETVQVSSDRRMDPQMSFSHSASGLVVGPGDVAVAEATVEAYVHLSGRPILLSSATTDTSGRFLLDIPILREGD